MDGARCANWQLALAHRLTYSYHIDEGRFPRVLQPHQGELHLLLPEERLEPVQQFVDERYHLCRSMPMLNANAARWLC